MEGNLEWLKFRDDWFDVLLALSKPEMDRLLTAIREYSNDREVPEMTGRESFPWILIKAELEKDKTSRRKAADAHREAGAKGGRPRAEETNKVIEETKKTNLVLEKPNEIKENQNNQIDTVKELRVKSTEVKEVKNNICAEAHVSAPEKPKLTPNDHDFWKFAKENAELAEAFYKASGLYPIGNQFGRWVNDLKNFREAGITVQQMQAAVQKIRREGRITISAPGSVFTTARDISLGGSSGRVVTQPKPQNKTAYEMLKEMGIV